MLHKREAILHDLNHKLTFGDHNFVFSFLNKACQSDFEQIHTLYGNCYRFHPKETDQFLAPFGRQAGLSLILSFNESDWTSGWNHLLKGWQSLEFSMQHIVNGPLTFVRPCNMAHV